jgi:hypothetical protein
MYKLIGTLLISLSVTGLVSCKHSIRLDVATRSSDLNHCEYIFGKDINSLKYENAFLLQTGTIDTTTEQPPIPIAIIIIDKKEIILKLKSQHEENNQFNRMYEGEGYKLNLNYKEEAGEYYQTIFPGKFILEKDGYKSEYDIVGINCNL